MRGGSAREGVPVVASKGGVVVGSKGWLSLGLAFFSTCVDNDRYWWFTHREGWRWMKLDVNARSLTSCRAGVMAGETGCRCFTGVELIP